MGFPSPSDKHGLPSATGLAATRQPGKPRYGFELREHIVAQAMAGRSPASLALEFGPHERTINAWIAQHVSRHGLQPQPAATLNAQERAGLARLRREVQSLRMECAWLAKTQEWRRANRTTPALPLQNW